MNVVLYDVTGRSASERSPSCAIIIWRDSGSPMPDPLFFVVKNGTNTSRATSGFIGLQVALTDEQSVRGQAEGEVMVVQRLTHQLGTQREQPLVAPLPKNHDDDDGCESCYDIIWGHISLLFISSASYRASALLFRAFRQSGSYCRGIDPQLSAHVPAPSVRAE